MCSRYKIRKCNVGEDMQFPRINNEFLFVLYIFLFLLIRPLNYFIGYSQLVLIISCFFILFLSLLINTNKKKKIQSYIPVSIVILFLILFLIDILFRPNSFSFEHIYYYIIFGIIPVYLYIYVTNYKFVLKYYNKFSIFLFFVYVFDPFLDYNISGGYMNFGYLGMLPIFYGIHVGYKIFNKKYLLIFEIICLIELFLFANKVSFLAAILFIVLIDFFTNKLKILKLFYYISLVLIGLLVWNNFVKIIEYLIKILNDYKIFSYSLNSYYYSISNESIEIMFSSRLEIWRLSWEMFLEKPIFGHGVGAFEDKYGFYTHNVFLDIAVFWGLPLLVVFILFIIKGFHSVFIAKGYHKVLGILFLVHWFPMLIFSRQFIESYGFWLFISFGLLVFQKNCYDFSLLDSSKNNNIVQKKQLIFHNQIKSI